MFSKKILQANLSKKNVQKNDTSGVSIIVFGDLHKFA